MKQFFRSFNYNALRCEGNKKSLNTIKLCSILLSDFLPFFFDFYYYRRTISAIDFQTFVSFPLYSQYIFQSFNLWNKEFKFCLRIFLTELFYTLLNYFTLSFIEFPQNRFAPSGVWLVRKKSIIYKYITLLMEEYFYIAFTRINDVYCKQKKTYLQ